MWRCDTFPRMTSPGALAGERFAAVCAALLQEPGVVPPEPGRGFGANSLRVNGKIFAMLSAERLVCKLPRVRVEGLIASGDGEPFDPRKDGRGMKEWLSLHPGSDEDWVALAREALAFAAPGVRLPTG